MPSVRRKISRSLLVVAAATFALAGCGSDTGGPKATKLRIDPGTATIDIGSTVRLVATPVDAQGNVVVSANPIIEWRSATPGVASVAQDGVVTAVATGTATIEALAGSLSGTATITVNRPPVASMTIEPTTISLSRGATGTLTSRVVTTTGSVVTDRTVNWTSLDPTVATVTGTGQSVTVTATAPGTTTIRATSEGINAQSTVIVGPDPVIALSSPGAALVLARTSRDTAERTIEISNSSGGALTGLSTAVSYGSGGSGWLIASLSSTSVPSTLSLRAVAGTLDEGTYEATVTIASSRPGVTPRDVGVSLRIGRGPEISLSLNSTSFTSFAGGPPPSAQSFTISNLGGAALTDLSIGTIDWGGTTWANVSLSGTTAPASLTITPTAAASSLPQGTYTANIPVVTALPGVAPRVLVAALNVTAAPVISLSPSSLQFTAALGGSAPAPQSVTITNTGNGTLTGLGTGGTAYSPNASGWLNVQVTEGNGSGSALFTVNSASLGTGTYTAAVTIVSTNPFVAGRQIGVTLVVGAAQVIAIASPSVSQTVSQGGASPAPMSIPVTNAGTGTLSGLSADPVTYTGGASGWLSASLAGASAPTSIALTFSTGALAVGTYGASVTIRSSVANVLPAVLSVSLTVQSGAIIAVASPVNFTALSGGTNPAAQVLAVANAGVGTLTGLSLGNTIYGNGQPAGWLSASLSAASAPASLTIAPASAGLAVGTYTATLPVQSSLPGVATRSITVVLRVNPATTIAVSTSNVTLNAPNGGGNPAAANVSVTNAGSNPLTGLTATVTYNGSAPTNWLTATLSSTEAPSTLTLSASVASLVSGNYSATVEVASPVALNSPRVINVTLVIPPPVIAVSQNSTSASVNQSVGNIVTGFSPASMSVSNSGGGRLTGLSTAITYNQGSGWLNATVSSPAAPSVLSFSVNTSGAAALARGTYTATVAISGNGSSTVFVDVTLRVVYTYNTHIASLWTAAPGVPGGSQCAASGCHDNVTKRSNIDLITNSGANTVYARLLSQVGSGSKRLVLPNDPNGSLMYTRSIDTSNPMPQTGIVAAIYTKLFDWITDGAKQ